jgi:cobalt-zinc-cadmium efflux system outer membrane protein
MRAKRDPSRMKIRLRSTLVTLAPFALAATHAAHAQQGVTLSQAVAMALRDNPDARIALAAVDSARGERRIAAALPNPMLSGLPNTPYQYAVSLPLDVMPSRLYRTRAASIGAHASTLDRSDVLRQVRLSVSRAFLDVLLAQERRTLAKDRRTAVLQLLVADSVRVRAGDAPARNLVRSEVELARADAEQARADVDAQVSRGTLQALMGVAHPDTGFVAIGSLAYRALATPPESLEALALANRADLSAAQLRVQGSRASQRLASSLVLPTPVVSYVRQYTAPFESGHYYSLGVAFDLPLLNLRGGERDRAAAGLASARFAQDRVAIGVQRDVAAADAEFRIQRALVERYESGLLRRMDEGLTAVRYAYSRGASSLLDVLDAVRSNAEVRSDYVVALHDYWVSVHALNAAVGIDVFGVQGDETPMRRP